MASFTFTPSYATVAHVQPTWPAEELLSQPGFYAADLSFAHAHATAPLQAVLAALPESYLEEGRRQGMEVNVDVRVHELKRGDYPATPGWHCDAPLRETEFSEKGERTPVLRSLVANLSSVPGGVSNTIFATEAVTLPDDSMDYGTWKLLDEALSSSSAVEVTRDGELIEFSCYSPHTIQPAVTNGVRLFVRASLWRKPEGFTPGLTHCEQVYRKVNL